MGSDHRISIERNRNGYEVSVSDPKIIESNNKNRGEGVVWKSPCTEYQFDDKAQVMAFVEKVFDDALPGPSDEYSAAFDAAAKEAKTP